MSNNNFNISKYKILETQNPKILCIEGYKLSPPSKRITLKLSGVKILSAKIIFKHKKGDIACEITRINRLKTMDEIRLHTNSTLYPGEYQLRLEYSGNLLEDQLSV
jgi:hypothetical protein